MRFDFWQTGFPVLGLMALAVLLPLATVPRYVLAQGRLARGMMFAGGVEFALAAGVFAWSYAGGETGIRPGAVLWATVLSTFAWGPVWALVWLIRAQAVEKRKARAATRAGLDLPGPG